MTVRELIEKLNALTEEQKGLEVITAGCDCDGDVGNVVVIPAAPQHAPGDPRGACVYLERS